MGVSSASDQTSKVPGDTAGDKCHVCQGSGQMAGPSSKCEVEPGVFFASADFGGKEKCGHCDGSGFASPRRHLTSDTTEEK